MKKIFVILCLFILFATNPIQAKVISNEKIDNAKVETASKIITNLQREMSDFTKAGAGPFVAAIYDDKGNLVVKVANSFVAGFEDNIAEISNHLFSTAFIPGMCPQLTNSLLYEHRLTS